MQRFLFVFLCFVFSKAIVAQQSPNWSKDQLMEPAQLAAQLQAGKELPVILSVGPGAYIPRSVDIGMVREKANLDKLKKYLKGLPANSNVVVYCGCCPFEHCPNVGPAIQVLKDMKFTRFKLLNLEHNIRVDWIAKGYPVTH